MLDDLFPGERKVLEKLGQVKPPEFMVDVGCSWGAWTEGAQVYCPTARVESFDPQSGTPALGAYNGEMAIYLTPNIPYLATGILTWGEQLQTYKILRTVPVRRLDSFTFPHIDFLKIDVEGMEWEVLEGLGILRPGLVQFEWGAIHTFRDQPLQKFVDFFLSWAYPVVEIDWLGTYGNYLAGPEELVKRLL